MVENAIPRDALITKERAQEIEQQRKQEKANHHHNRRHLTVYTENAKPAPARMDDETIHLVKVGNSVMECSLRHDPHEEEAAEGTTLRRRGLQQGSPPTEARISPKPGAVLHSSYIDFVVDVFDADDDLFWIAFYLNNHAAKAVSRTRFQPTHGNGQYTLRLGPFSSGGYEWSIRARDQQAFHSDAGELEYDSFSVELPDGASPTMIFPTALADDLFSYHDPSRQPPNNLAPGPTTMAPPLTMTTATSPTGGTPGTSPSPPLVGGDVAELPPGVNSPTTDAAPPATIGTTPSTSQWTPPTSLQTPSTFVPPTTPQTPSTFIPPTTPASPPRTITPPTTYTPPTNSGGGSVNFVYHSPSTTGKTADPVTFEWEVTGAQVFVSLLYIKYPDGGETYLTRQPTATGRDTVTTALNEKGIYKWSIWAQSEVGSFQEGPWQTFEIEEGIPDPNCPEHLARFTDRNHDLHKAIGRILYTINGHNYLCSGTLVDGANDRAVIATAAHCMYDSETGSFPSKVMFIPGQDDGEGDSSDYNCFNDPHGTYPTGETEWNHYVTRLLSISNFIVFFLRPRQVVFIPLRASFQTSIIRHLSAMASNMTTRSTSLQTQIWGITVDPTRTPLVETRTNP